jgi:hypothetical protein
MREGLAGGLDREALARQGVGGIRRRPPDDVAEEVAELHHGKGARFLVLLDDNLLAGDPDAAVAWVRALRRAMERRGVGRTAWSLQLEASAVTDELVDELEALGAVRVLVGVDALTEQGLRRLGRPADPGIASRAIARLRRTGAVVSLNSILVHPGTDSPTIRAEVEALAALRGVHFDALPLVVYAGTRVWRDLRRSGELSGGAYSWRHELADSGVGRYRSALVRMRTHGMGPYGPNILAHDVAVNVALASRLGIDPRPAERAATVRALLDGLNARRIAFLFEAWELSVAPLAPAQHGTRMHELVGRFAHEMRGFGARFERLQSCLERETGAAGEPRNLFFRSAIAASLLLCGSAAAGCFQSHGATGPPDGAGDPGSDLHDGLADDGDGEARPDADDDAARPDADEAEGRPDTDAYDHAARPDVLDGDVPAAECGSPEERYLQEERARQLSIDAGCPCFISHGPRYGLVVDSTGHVVDVCPIDDSVVTDEVRACYLEALAGETFPCLAGEECWAVCMEILM